MCYYIVCCIRINYEIIYASSHRTFTKSNFDEYAGKVYLNKFISPPYLRRKIRRLQERLKISKFVNNNKIL